MVKNSNIAQLILHVLAFPLDIDGYVSQQDVASEITAELQGYPDFIIGNYSDGNLVASLLAYKMGVTQVLISLLCHLYFRKKIEV